MQKMRKKKSFWVNTACAELGLLKEGEKNNYSLFLCYFSPKGNISITNLLYGK